MKFAVACGGTGGHILPGVVTAVELRRRGHAVTLWLSGRDVERLSAGGWDGPVRRVPSGGFPARLSPAALKSGLLLLRGLLASRRFLRDDRPDGILAMGGYGSMPPVLTARSLGIPCVLHESNAIPGRANLMLARRAAAVALQFEQARRFFDGTRTVVTGFPLRNMSQPPLRAAELDPGVLTVLVAGGSQGAQYINRTVLDALVLLRDAGVAVQTIHLTGAANEAETVSAYSARGLRGWVKGYWQDMGALYSAADLAVCRAGAATCAELAATGTPALLVPLPTAMKNHQEANARALAEHGGADVCLQPDLTAGSLCRYLSVWHSCREELKERRQAMLRADRSKGAAERLADLLESCAAGKS